MRNTWQTCIAKHTNYKSKILNAIHCFQALQSSTNFFCISYVLWNVHECIICTYMYALVCKIVCYFVVNNFLIAGCSLPSCYCCYPWLYALASHILLNSFFQRSAHFFIFSFLAWRKWNRDTTFFDYKSIDFRFATDKASLPNNGTCHNSQKMSIK